MDSLFHLAYLLGQLSLISLVPEYFHISCIYVYQRFFLGFFCSYINLNVRILRYLKVLTCEILKNSVKFVKNIKNINIFRWYLAMKGLGCYIAVWKITHFPHVHEKMYKSHKFWDSIFNKFIVRWFVNTN